MEITIVGSGNGGCAMAAVQAMHGHKVNIIKLSSAIHNENFSTLQRDSKIRLSGKEGQGEFALAKVTKDPAEAIPEAELILVYYVANYTTRWSPSAWRHTCTANNASCSIRATPAACCSRRPSKPLETTLFPYSQSLRRSPIQVGSTSLAVSGSIRSMFATRSLLTALEG